MIEARDRVLEMAERFRYMSRLNTVDRNDRQAMAASHAYGHAANALAGLGERMMSEGIEQEEIE